jgi:hypothetical protein
MIRFRCPCCETLHRADDRFAGRATRCHACKTPITIPDTNAVEQPAPAVPQETTWQPVADKPASPSEEIATVLPADSDSDVADVSTERIVKRRIAPSTKLILIIGAVVLGIPAVAVVGFVVFVSVQSSVKEDANKRLIEEYYIEKDGKGTALSTR